MVKVKLFNGYTHEVQDEIDAWQAEEPNIVILSAQSSKDNSYTVTTILYEDNAKIKI